jgi:hypothetical protein
MASFPNEAVNEFDLDEFLEAVEYTGTDRKKRPVGDPWGSQRQKLAMIHPATDITTSP